jgi:alpha-L-rhamnosidase
MRGLTEYGNVDLAYRIATNRSYPSWGYMIDHGATTIWELWNGDTADPSMNSRNHVMLLGDVIVWMYENLAGIRNNPDTLGYKSILMAPSFPEGLDYVDASHMTPYGEVTSKWHRNGDKLEWTVDVPVNTYAIVQVPAKFGLRLKGDRKGVHGESVNDGKWTAEIGSGTYTFVSAND